MEHTFWHDKWEKGEIGFHQSDIHPMNLVLAMGAAYLYRFVVNPTI